jgi:hypothetical protein
VAILILLAIFGFFVSPFDLSGHRRTWRAAAGVFVVLAIYTATLWLQPLPPYFHEQDQMGAQAWQGIVLVLVICSALAFTGGLAVSASKQRNGRS